MRSLRVSKQIVVRKSFIHKIFVKMFYGMMSESTGIDMSRASDFKLLDRKAVDAFIALPERHVFFQSIVLLGGI